MSWLPLALTLCLASAPKLVPPTLQKREQEAVRLYREGLQRYNLREYDAAIERFKAAYVLTNAPELLYNIAQGYRLQEPPLCKPALGFYRSYLRATPASPRRRAVESAVSDMEACLSKEVVQTRVVLLPASTSPPPPPPKPVPHRLVPAWVAATVGGVGGGLALSGGGLWLATRSDYANLHTTCAPYCSTATVAGLRNRQTAASVLMISGVSAAVAGTVLWLVGQRMVVPPPVESTTDGVGVHF